MRYFLTILIPCLIFPYVAAQPDFKKELHIGLSQGAAISRMVFDPYVSQQFFTGYTGGLIVRYISQPKLGIQLEANYLQRGWMEETKSLGTYKRSQDLLSFPLMTHLYFGKTTKLRFQFVLGPYVAYILSDAEKINIADSNEYKDYYGKEIARKFEFGYTGGLAVAFRTRIGIFELEGRYNHSLTNLFKPEDEEFIYLGSRPFTVYAALHYLVNIPGK